ncbi:MAG TPA: CocE/NonD family hydrolase [Actinomycetota bacterium]|nr:CocE/NonD family hydrolase [Actinomycetota bacterium]
MRRTRKTALTLLGAVAAGLFVVPVTPATAAAFEIVTESHVVETRHGDVFVEVARPVDGTKMVKGPAILTYSPYSILSPGGRTAGWEDYVSAGYVRVFADVVGTGNSGGCWDYGGIREKESAYDLVEWVAKQDWSTGKVGMIGGSYNGTTANAAAVMRPPHLTTIVPEAAISRWYGYAYSGGIRYSLNNEALGPQGPGAVADEGIDTPLLFDGGLAVPPPTDPAGPGWQDRVASTITPCDEISHTQHGYDDTPDYDEFWIERDYLRHAKKVTIPVLVASNWGDWNVKQEESWNWFKALKNSEKRVLYMGTRWEGHGAPSAEHYANTVRAWFDHYLMGIDNGVENMAAIVTQTSDADGPGRWFRHKKAPNVTNVELIAQQTIATQIEDWQWQMLPDEPNMKILTAFGEATTATFTSAFANTEAHALHHARSNHDWFWFETPVLKEDTRIFGQIKVKMYSSIQRKWITLTPTIADVDPSEHVSVGPNHVVTCPPDAPETCSHAMVGVTRGFLDSRYRNSLATQEEIVPGEPFKAKVVAKPQDYTFKKGHYIGINLQTEINEWMVPKLYPGCDKPPGPAVPPDPNAPTATGSEDDCLTFRVHWEESKTRLILPIVNAPANVHDLFAGTGHGH